MTQETELLDGMSREIKFRVWDVENKEMVEFPKLGVIKDIDTGSDELLLGCLDHKCGYEGINYFNSQTEAETILLQYTGCKDRNGKEIYEGDIIKMGSLREQVKWFHQDSAFLLGDHEDEGPELMNFYKLKNHSEIVGNIYETPELLESDDE